MFQPIRADQFRFVMKRKLDIAQFRLTPKESGARLIMNLGKRKLEKLWPGKVKLGPSINRRLEPIKYVLNCERMKNPGLVGSSLFSTDELFPRLKEFKKRLKEEGLWKEGGRLYFVKVDVTACFDTIPQKAVLDHVAGIVGEEKEYMVVRHDEMRPAVKAVGDEEVKKKPFVKMQWRAGRVDDIDDDGEFSERMEKEKLRNGLVLIDHVLGRSYKSDDLLQLLERHVQFNVVKVNSPPPPAPPAPHL